MKKLRLKGCLWKPGINGLGVRGFHHIPYRVLFDIPARMHDNDYDKQGKGNDRFDYDVTFLRNCLWLCSKDVETFFAILYFIFVRIFGWMFFRYHR